MLKTVSAAIVRPMSALFLRKRLVARRLCLIGPAVIGMLASSAPLRADPADLPATIDRTLDVPAVRGGITAYIIQRMPDGAVIYERNADLRLMPASNRKLFTTAAVLGVLGDDYTITTKILLREPVSNGEVSGDIYLKGAGDSLLSVADLDAMARSVAAAGVKHVRGGVVGDGHVFEDGPYGSTWGWDSLDEDYEPAIAGLEVNDGVVTIVAGGGPSVGSPVTFRSEPAYQGLPIVSQAVTVAAGERADLSASRRWRSDVVRLRGTVPLHGSARVQIPVIDPADFAADQFRQALERAGVKVDGSAWSGHMPASATVEVASHASPPMKSYIASMNKPSDNLLAESLIRVVGIKASQHGAYDAGDAAERDFLQTLGIDVEGLTLEDGSGVARRNYVTARSVGRLLLAMSKRQDFDAFVNSLPIGGVDGTLRRRFVKGPGKGNVRAKTGTLTGASALSGYFTGASGQRYLFSLIVNNYPGTATQIRSVEDVVLEESIRNL